MLTTDEQRERKAELQNPGTYHVIANPDSFISLPEYREESTEPTGSVTPGSRNNASDLDDIHGTGPGMNDPNTVILRKFEEPACRGSIQSLSTSSAHPASPAFLQKPLDLVPNPQALYFSLPEVEHNRSMLGMEMNGGRDFELLQHYRATISPHLMQAENSESSEDLFEAQAKDYPPVR